MIIVENLKKMYGSVVGTNNVSFAVKGGDIFGFIGPNGAGKSTTIKCIMGLAKPTSGYCELLGVDATKNGHQVRSQVGFMPADDSMPADLTGQEFLELTCKIKNSPTDRIVSLAKRFEVPLNRKIKHLSSGNRKKVAIISAVCTNPKVIILDEPTNGLDPLMQQIFFDVLREQAKMGASILFSTHILGDIQKVCNKVAIIKNGNIVSIEEGEGFKLKQVKDVTFETEWVTPDLKMVKLEGAKNVKYDGKRVSFEYNGNIKNLVTYLNSLNVVNLEIRDIDLERLFMRYYE